MILSLRDVSDLTVSQQAHLLSIDLPFYWEILAEVMTWLTANGMLSQADRVTDTRLAERVPEDVQIRCKRCGQKLAWVPCVECNLQSSGKTKSRHDSGSESLTWLGLGTGRAMPLAPEPTRAEPGSRAKFDVMCARAELGYSVFHPRDAGINRRCSTSTTKQ